MKHSLLILAGDAALRHVRENGLRPDDVKVVLGAAGGPKWMVLGGLDRYLFPTWFKGRKAPLFLLGSSIGAWRFSAVCGKNPLMSLETFQDAYIRQSYLKKPTAAEVTEEGWRILRRYVADGGAGILTHKTFRLSLITVRGRGPMGSENNLLLGAGLAAAALSNALLRKSQALFWERTLFYDGRDRPPFLGMDNFRTRTVPLTPDNLKAAVMASGSIPLVMSGVRDIPGAPRGLYRDGGLVDYNMDVPTGLTDGIALFPHYNSRVVPGWFDKRITWRKPHREYMDRVLMLCPSPEFISRFPLGKIPDRDDFKLFFGRDDERMKYWRTVLAESERIADEFAEAVSRGRLAEIVRPMF